MKNRSPPGSDFLSAAMDGDNTKQQSSTNKKMAAIFGKKTAVRPEQYARADGGGSLESSPMPLPSENTNLSMIPQAPLPDYTYKTNNIQEPDFSQLTDRVTNLSMAPQAPLQNN
ncbi:unnamed protein product, partial [Heterosigma akashiwo]